MRRIPADVWLILAACVGAWGLFVSLGRLWPLVPGDLHVPPARLRALSARFLATQGVSVTGYDYATDLNVDDYSLRDVNHRFGQAQTRRWITADVPLVRYTVLFKRQGDPREIFVSISAATGRVVEWRRDTQTDDPAIGQVNLSNATKIAAAARDAVDLNKQRFPPWKQVGYSERAENSAHLNRLFSFERLLSPSPELRERASVKIEGGQVVSVYRSLLPFPPAVREYNSRATGVALQTVGEILLGLAVMGAFLVFLVRLRAGDVRLRPATLTSGLVFVCTLVASLLQGKSVFAEWNPLWPRPVSLLRTVVSIAQSNLWTIVALLAVVAAGDALDRESGANRGATFWKLTRGRIFDRDVGAASGRGFLLGLIAGGVLAGGVWAVSRLAPVEIALQPQGFFLAILNSPLPGLDSLLYFLHVALLEEMGYRFFAGTWLLRYTRRPLLAVVLPAVVYGLTHTTLSFLPPAEPFWGRALVMTLVGCVWGVAFLRYDALTVVISHLTCDLFIFNWPRLASGDPWLIASAALTVLVPLVPALGLLGRIVPPPHPPFPRAEGAGGQ